MNVYQASYYAQYGYGAYDEIEDIVIANTKAEGLGLVLEANLNTTAVNWTLTEIDTDDVGVHSISSRSN